jgi:hypothetical protein
MSQAPIKSVKQRFKDNNNFLCSLRLGKEIVLDVYSVRKFRCGLTCGRKERSHTGCSFLILGERHPYMQGKGRRFTQNEAAVIEVLNGN